MTDINLVLAERQKVHGDFADDARYSQTIKQVLQNGHFERVQRRQSSLRYTQVEAMEQIATKLGRILAGDSDEIDHWKDISGYATLIANEIQKEHDAVAAQQDTEGRRKAFPGANTNPPVEHVETPVGSTQEPV